MKQFGRCSISYYAILLFIFMLLVIQYIWGIRYLSDFWKRNPDLIAEGDINWRLGASGIPFIAFFIGSLTSLIGMGGSELLGPVLIAMKVSSCFNVA